MVVAGGSNAKCLSWNEWHQVFLNSKYRCFHELVKGGTAIEIYWERVACYEKCLYLLYEHLGCVLIQSWVYFQAVSWLIWDSLSVYICLPDSLCYPDHLIHCSKYNLNFHTAKKQRVQMEEKHPEWNVSPGTASGKDASQLNLHFCFFSPFLILLLSISSSSLSFFSVPLFTRFAHLERRQTGQMFSLLLVFSSHFILSVC